MKRPFDKVATTHEEQVALLKKRGMLIDNAETARFYLQHISYYRLGAYWLPFEADHTSHTFKAGTRFEDVLNLYRFDRELRLLLLDAIERLEVSVRSAWAYTLAHHHGPHAHLNSSLASDPDRWQSNLKKLTEEVKRSDELFIKHLCSTYSETLPPIWAVSEVISFGLLSRWYKNLEPRSIRTAIVQSYDVNERVFSSWLHHLTIVRNVCAHHSRLWNREFAIKPKPPKTKPSQLAGIFVADSPKIYNTLLILLYFMDVVAPNHHWRERLKTLLKKHIRWLNAMGFPQDWESQLLWQEKI